MRLRSLLFVPGDSERKFARGRESGADALILDLEDAVAPLQKAAARDLVGHLLDRETSRPWAFFVRVNALDTGLTLDDMAAVVKPGLDGLVIPKATPPISCALHTTSTPSKFEPAWNAVRCGSRWSVRRRRRQCSTLALTRLRIRALQR